MTQSTATKPATRACPRCCGTGEKFHGMCFLCKGIGTIDLTRRSVKVDPLLGERRYQLILALREHAMELDGYPNGPIAAESAWGRDLLESREPERHAHALTSIEQGRTDDVIHALVAYYRESVGRFPAGTLVSFTYFTEDEEGDLSWHTRQGLIDAYYGLLDEEPHWIIRYSDGTTDHVPDSKIQAV